MQRKKRFLANWGAFKVCRAIGVLGGTGKTGRRVAERLTSRDVPIRIGSRSGKPPFEWENQSTWAPVLQNVESVYMVYYPDLAVPGAADAIRAFTNLAVQHDVQRLVLLSGRGEEEAQHCEHIVQNAGANWTLLRASWFCQNFSEGFLRDLVLTGEVALPAGAVVEPFIGVEDIADVAALTEDGHAGQLYELTGPRLLTFTEVVGEIALATSHEVRARNGGDFPPASCFFAVEVAGTRRCLSTFWQSALSGWRNSCNHRVQRAYE